ncbi:50S ribosome-binding GTPase [Candidatus Woesearchaeota archaeon]|nr:50S ribosome-binding GTPase [Candidatus Woesearchaeota archaeon]
MSFATIAKIEKYQFYLDLAVQKSKKEIDDFRGTVKAKDNLNKSKDLELKRLEVMRRELSKPLHRIMREFPSIDNLTEFYKELIKIEIGIVELKKALATLKWTDDKLTEFCRLYSGKIKKAEKLVLVNEYRRDYLGRISSLFKRNREIFDFLDECRKIFITFPAIKDGIYSVAISGYPNVGKSTLLSRVTSSKPKISDYAFTTVSLLTGYHKTETSKIQFIDTPGTLNRRDAENAIERMSYCAIKYTSDMIVFVFDPTLYGFEQQYELLKRLDVYGKDVVVYVSKLDMYPKEVAELKQHILTVKPKIKIFDNSVDLMDEIKKRAIELF